MIVSVLITALVYACAAFLAMRFSVDLSVRDGGRLRESTPLIDVLSIATVFAGSLIGGALAWRNANIPQVVVVGITLVTLCASWYALVMTRQLPKLVIVPALALLAGVAIVFGYWAVVWKMLLMGFVFGIGSLSAYLLKPGQRGLWVDPAIAALAGAALTVPLAFLALGAGCLTFILVASLKHDRTTAQYGPFLAASIVFTMLLDMVVGKT